MNINKNLTYAFISFVLLLAASPGNADLLLRESFDIPTGTLDNQAGATSFGFDPVFGTVWDSGVFGSPLVGAGSIFSPGSTAGFYSASPLGNRVVEDYQGTTISREDDVSAPHLYGTFLTDINLNGFFSTRSSVLFTNFSIFAENPGNSSTAANWFVQTSGGIFDSGISAQGTTLVSWELLFDETNALAPDTLQVWFNSDPLRDSPDILRTVDDLGQFDLGGIGLKNDIYLGLSVAQFDEFLIGTDWSSVGIHPVPEPGGVVTLMAIALACLASKRRHRKSS